MKYDFKGKSALVIGGSGSIGRAVCNRFAECGLGVTLTYFRNKPAAEELLGSLPSTGRPYRAFCLDLADRPGLRAALGAIVADMEEPCAAVFAAGHDIPQPFVAQISDEEWSDAVLMEVNAHFVFTQSMVPILRARGGGSLTTVTTTATVRYALRNVLSSAPKAAMEALSKAVAKEEGRYGIRSNCVAPGMLASGVGERILQRDFTPTAVESIRKSIPLARFATPQDVAESVVFLASENAAFVSGQTLAVDGGWQV
ncbi:MAG: SDR family oxidoreductase [Mesorhizobium sp.]|nr:SDR family oxidoreductase [Mesorhizobium sp.]